MAQTNRRLWLIDAAYLLNARKSVGVNYYFDYLKLRHKIEEDGPIFQAFYLNSTPNPPSDEFNAFHAWLKMAPPTGPKLQVKLYQLKGSRFRCPDCRKELKKSVQKGVDIGIATLALSLIDRYDTLILSTGDGDFKDAVEYVRNTKDKRVELIVFRAGVSTDIQSVADVVTWIDDFADEVKSDKLQADAASVASQSGPVEPSRIESDGLERLFTVAIEEARDQEGWASLAKVGKVIKDATPGFNLREFGVTKLYELAAAQPYLEFEARKGHPFVRLSS